MIAPPLAFALLALQHGKPDDLAHDQTATYTPNVAPASDDARAAMQRFELAPGLAVELVAAEPSFAHPVAFWPANDGSFYVCETFRHHQGVTDIRDHMDWLDDDLAAKTVADRVANFRKQLGAEFGTFERAYERVSRLTDTDGDGVVDKSTVFSDVFRGAAAGINAGVLEHRGDVFVTCIPSLWKLRDTNADGRADDVKELSTGYGVHVALLGHDLHGLRIGLDQRLYFSIGDRGFDVQGASGAIHHAHSGAVLRCELDGSGLEVFATGLRNPQELVFDAHGDLFTGDNNSDGGDRARLVHVVEGSDSGWRQSYQWINEPALRGPWNEEQLWVPHFAGQAAYILPPIANFADGPSGLAIHPGTGFGGAYSGKLFLCDFRGDAKSSGVHAIDLAREGAGFHFAKSEHVLWKVLATDCDFGPDGALYVTDWTQGWNQTGKGRLWRVFDPASRNSDEMRRTRTLLASEMRTREDEELGALLADADQRVRLAAQFALAHRGLNSHERLKEIALGAGPGLARVHALWALAIQWRFTMPVSLPGALLPVGPKSPHDAEVVVARVLVDGDAELRTQAARVAGDLRLRELTPALVKALADEAPRVRASAALALARLAEPNAVKPLVELARATKDTDPVLRHAAIHALAACADDAALALLRADPSVDVRLAAVVALRKRVSPRIAEFLGDRDVLVRVETARAIYDVPIVAANSALAGIVMVSPGVAQTETSAPADKEPRAASANKAAQPDAEYDFARRSLNAVLREGTRPALLAGFALRTDASERLRREALACLASWREPPSRDPVTCAWQPAGALTAEQRDVRARADLAKLVHGMIASGIVDAPDSVFASWLALVEKYEVRTVASALEPLVTSTRASDVRCAALRALAALDAPHLHAMIALALADTDGPLRATALDALTKLAPAEARPLAERVLAHGDIAERRAACKILGALADPAANAALGAQLERLAAGFFPVEIAFDLVAAARARHDAALDAQLAQLDARRAHDPALAPFVDTQFGGDREAGKRVFREKSAVACLRCHKTEWDEGGTVGPDLRGIAKRQTRLQLVESIVQPNRHVSAGFRSTLFALTDDTVVDARVLVEDAEKFRVIDANARTFDLPKSTVESHRDGLSSMPEGFDKLLTPAEVRDLVEYLCSI